jgi:hypothetical protein
MDWIAEVHVQVGAEDAPPPPGLGAFLDGFVAGLNAHRTRQATLLEVPADDLMYANPTRLIRYVLQAVDEEAAQRLADEEFFPAGLKAGVAAVPPELRELGWMGYTEVCPA